MDIIVKRIFEGERFLFATHINEFLIDRNVTSNSEVFLVEIPPNSSTHLHNHEKFEQLFFIIDGKGFITTAISNEKIDIKENDIVFIPLNHDHCIHNAKNNKSLRYLCINSFIGKTQEKTSKSHAIKVVREFRMNPLDDNVFTNTPILITGANGFIGRNLVNGILSKGIPVLGIDKSFDILSQNHLYKQLCVNLLNENELFKTFNQYLESNPFPRYLICASGDVLSGKHAFNSSAADFLNQYNDNIIAAFNISKLYSQIASKSCTSDSGILFIGSIGADKSHREHIAYDSSKGALNSLCRSLAMDLAPYHITVNTISIGPIDFSPSSLQDGTEIVKLKKLVPLQRYARIEEIVDFILYFVFQNNKFVTGQNICIDGGLTIQLRPLEIEHLENPNLYKR